MNEHAIKNPCEVNIFLLPISKYYTMFLNENQAEKRPFEYIQSKRVNF